MLLAALAGCEGGSEVPDQKGRDSAERDAADGKVECALAGSDRFERVCPTEQIAANGATMLIIRHPDGGLRRFNILTDGRGLSAADGFDETRITLLKDSMIELSSGDDKYRLPAKIENTSAAADTVTTKDAS